MISNKKVCKNCKHLFISGMLQDWGSTMGYCLLIQNNKNIPLLKTESGTPRAKIESLKQLTDRCSKFEKSER